MNRTDKRIAVYIGKVLRAHRRALDITLSKVADKIGVEPATVNRYEKGRFNIPLTKYVRWCRALKVDGGKLMNEAQRHIFKGSR